MIETLIPIGISLAATRFSVLIRGLHTRVSDLDQKGRCILNFVLLKTMSARSHFNLPLNGLKHTWYASKTKLDT